MQEKILVAYASRHGSTAEVAETIAATLEEEGVEAKALPIADDLDPSPYTAVILGSAIYRGEWPTEIVSYVATHRETLQTLPVGLFSVGLMMRKPSEDAKYKAQAAMAPVRSLIKAVDIASFGGCCHNLPQPWKLMFRVLGAGGDYRDWEAIKRWSRSFLSKLPRRMAAAA